MKQIDMVAPDGPWQFDDEVTAVFDDMLERSIPQYRVMRDLVFEIGQQFVQPKTDVVDLGCSRGEALKPFIEKFGAQNHCMGIEVSQAMLTACRQRFEGLINVGCVSIRDLDLRRDFPAINASLVLSILTIQFIPIEYRQQIIQRIYNGLIEGGAFIFVEKVLGNTALLDGLLVGRYLMYKSANNYTQDQIERKRLALEGVLVPVTAKWNEDMLYSSGFKSVDCFWRYLNFAGWIAIK